MNNNINPLDKFFRLCNMYENSTDVKDLELTLKTIRTYADRISVSCQDEIIEQMFSKLNLLEHRYQTLSNISSTIVPIVGFKREGCNCWIISILLMMFCCPTSLEMYEKIAEHYRREYPALQEALDAFRKANESRQPVPSYVSQRVREALSALFNKRFSPYSYSQEDAREAFECLVALSEQIGFQPKFLKKMHETAFLEPTEAPREATPYEIGQYQALQSDRTITKMHDEWQINLYVPKEGKISFNQLLNDFFINKGEGNDLAHYIIPEGKIQSFKRKTINKFLQIPEELLININRFGENGSKIKTPLDIPQTLILPPSAVINNLPHQYALDFCVVHIGELGGGHYLDYKKIGNEWYEINDDLTRKVSQEEMNQLLQGKKGHTVTSYMHHYTLTKQGLFKVDYEGEGVITVCGSFSEWKPLALENGTFFLDSAAFKEGEIHEFKLLLNGHKWLTGENLRFTTYQEKDLVVEAPYLECRDGTLSLKRHHFDD